MPLLEFEAFLDDNVIRVPEDIATHLKGAAIRVSITPIPQVDMEPDKAWDSVLAFLHERMARERLSTPYTWRREDAYEHLTSSDAPNRVD
jgi:hypothetical protein